MRFSVKALTSAVQYVLSVRTMALRFGYDSTPLCRYVVADVSIKLDFLWLLTFGRIFSPHRQTDDPISVGNSHNVCAFHSIRGVWYCSPWKGNVWLSFGTLKAYSALLSCITHTFYTSCKITLMDCRLKASTSLSFSWPGQWPVTTGQLKHRSIVNECCWPFKVEQVPSE